MSGTGDGSLIATTRNAELQVLGTGGQLAVQAWDQISGYLRRARSPAHAALFAEPNPDADRGITDWYAAGQGEAPPLESLPEAAQEAARAEFTRLYGDIREEADRLRASTRESERFLGELLALALITPATDCLRVVGGQPVLVAWGHAKLGEAPSAELLIGMTRRRGGGLAPMQIVGPPAAPPEKRHWLFWLLGLLGLLLLLLLLLLLWRDPFGWFKAVPPQCVVQPGNIQLLDELRAAEAREAALRAEIAREMLRLGDRRTACPPPEPPPKPLDEPPPIMPVLREATDEVGRSGREIVAVLLLEVMRAAFFAIVLGFLGWARVLNCLALSPAAPPPWPVEKESGSFLTESVTVEITQIAAMRMRTRWMISEMVRPSPPSFCQKVRFERVAWISSAAGAPASVDEARSGSSG